MRRMGFSVPSLPDHARLALIGEHVAGFGQIGQHGVEQGVDPDEALVEVE